MFLAIELDSDSFSSIINESTDLENESTKIKDEFNSSGKFGLYEI